MNNIHILTLKFKYDDHIILNSFLGDLIESNIILLDTALHSLYVCLNNKNMIHLDIDEGSIVINQDYMVTESRIALVLEFFYELDAEMIDAYYRIIQAKTHKKIDYNVFDILSAAKGFIMALNKAI